MGRSGTTPDRAARTRAAGAIAVTLLGAACASGPRIPPPPPPPPPSGAAGAAVTPNPSQSGPAQKYRICRTRVCKGGDPARRQYFDERRGRYYFFDPVRKRYYWEDGSPRA